MKRDVLVIYIGITLIVMGVFVVFVASLVRSENARIITSPSITPNNSKPVTVSGSDTIQGKPIRLRIPDVNIDNKVIDGVFDEKSGEWTLTTDKVQHALMTYQPNDKAGLTFMYGHNRREVFSRLSGIHEGTLASVTTENGHVFMYRFSESRVTKPNDISVFSYTGSPILVLQTCTGLFYENRELYTFEFIGVESV